MGTEINCFLYMPEQQKEAQHFRGFPSGGFQVVFCMGSDRPVMHP